MENQIKICHCWLRKGCNLFGKNYKRLIFEIQLFLALGENWWRAYKHIWCRDQVDFCRLQTKAR